MTVAVTGPTGHVGGNLVRALLNDGRKVRALVYRDGPALEGLDVERCQGDVLDRESLRAAFDGVETVYHLAAVITLDHDPKRLAWRVNVGGTRNVIDACLACGVKRMVHFSSIHALSPHPRDKAVTEERALALDPDVPVYDRSKAQAEALVLAAVKRGLDALIVSPTGVVGPYDFELSRMGRSIVALSQGRIPLLLPGGFNWVDVRDVATAAINAEKHGLPGERYLVGGHFQSLRRLANMVGKVTGARRNVPVAPPCAARMLASAGDAASRMAGREMLVSSATLHTLCNHQRVDCTKARERLGHRPRSFTETLSDTIDWFRMAGYC